jgi:protein-S-isoprenylcysteine O-methyltransferase Ste14
MTMLYGPLIGLLWAAWYIYWVVAAIGVKKASRQESLLSRLSHTAPLIIAVALVAAPRPWHGWLSDRFLPRTVETYWLGVAILAVGLGFAVWARRYLGRNWSGTVTVKRDHELIRTGPYRFVRHPIYTGILLGFLGTAVSLGQWRGLLAVAFATFAFLLKIRLEEKWMTEPFGEMYVQYRKEVRALIPFVL